MSLLWTRAMMPDIDLRSFAPAREDDTVGPSQHHEHRMHPWLRDAGFGESPCTDVTCPAYNPDHEDRLEEAYATKGKIETHEPGSVRLHGFESHIDPATVLRYAASPPVKNRPPKVFTSNGRMHVLDGHHRLLADTIAKRPMTFEHVDLDGGA